MTSPNPARDGWKLVPVEPTDEMCAPLHSAMRDFVEGDSDTLDINAIWSAMLASAPAPASGGVDAVGALELARRVLSGRPDRSLADDLAIQRIDLALAASLSPAATSGSEAGGDVKGCAAVYDGQIKSCHRNRETCIADAEHYQAIHPVYLGPAWRHQED